VVAVQRIERFESVVIFKIFAAAADARVSGERRRKSQDSSHSMH
jgi:hypothetical protein